MPTFALAIHASLVALAAGCAADSEPMSELDSTIELLDPCTGTPVGYKDLDSSEYRFANGTVIGEAQIDRSADLELDACAIATLATIRKVVAAWSMSERYPSGSGGTCTAECSGYAINNGDGSYTVAESCSDTCT